MGKNINTGIWSIDSSGYTQTVNTLFTSENPVYTHADHIDNSFNFCVNGVIEQQSRAVLHMTERGSNTYSIENIDCVFVPDYIYDNRGNIGAQTVNTVFGGSASGNVSNFAIAPDSVLQPSGGDFKICVNFNYLTNVWSPKIHVANINSSTGVISNEVTYTLNDMESVSTAGDANPDEIWWDYYKRKETDHILWFDYYNGDVYRSPGAFQSTSVFEGQTRRGVGTARVSWLSTPHPYGNTSATRGCCIYHDNARPQYSDYTFDVLFSWSADIMVKKAEWDDEDYSKPRHNIIYGIKIDRNTVMRLIASYGLPFSFSSQVNITIGHADYALPEIKNNATTGNWFRGADAITADTDNNRWANTADIDNKPAGGGGGGSDDDSYADMGVGVGTGVGGYTSFAIMTKNDLVDLLADFNANLEVGMSVVNNFICLYKLGPLASSLCSTRVGNIIMSANATTNFVSIRADYNIVTSQKDVITLGSYNVPRMTNTFYDFAPYSTYELFIPCCGWVPLPDTVAGRQITVYLIIDLSSCTCKGICRIGGTTVAEASGVLGVSVPFFSTDSGIKRAADLMAVTQVISGIAQGAVGAGAGAGALVVSGSANALQGLEQLYINGNTNYTAIKGGNGDITAVGNGEYCTLKIAHPKVDEVVNNSRFGHSVGYLCNTVGKIKEFKGFTVCANPHVNGIDCTDSEKEEIKRLLEEGIIVN